MIMTEKSTCSLEASPVSHIQFPGLEKGLTTPEGTSRLSLLDLLIELEQSGLLAKTCRVFYRKTQDGHLQLSFRFSADGKSKSQSSKEEKTAVPSADGKTAESLPRPPEGTDWLGELWTLNLCEWNRDFPGPFRKDEGVCSLSAILVTGVIPRKYYLSRDASLGILNRAAKRGKELPADLKLALLAVVNQT
jgi:hypothetical protein